MARPKGKHDIAPMIRAALIRAAARKSKDGDGVSYLATQFEKYLEDDFLATLNAVGKFTVREKEVSGTIEHVQQLTDEQRLARLVELSNIGRARGTGLPSGTEDLGTTTRPAKPRVQ